MVGRIVIYHLTLLVTIIHSTTHYKSYYFNLTNLSQWTINQPQNTDQIFSKACTINIPSLCISNNPITSTLNILYKHSTFTFLNYTQINNKINSPNNNIIPHRRRLRSSRRIPIYRYWHGSRRDHFYTQNHRELGRGRGGYKSEGIGFYLSSRRSRGMIPLYRYWKHNIHDHFYTTNRNEIGTTRRGRTGRHGYKYEGIIGYCYPSRRHGTVPLYRYWKSGRWGDHFYTTNSREIGTTRRGRRGKHGYHSEGTTCYVWKSRATNRRRPTRRRRNRHSNRRCGNVIYERKGRTRPRRGRRFKRINFENNMIISLEVRVNSFPRQQWGNIIHCGSRNTIRQPGIWINKYTKKFHIVYGTKRNWNQLKNSHFRIQLRKKYKIEYRIRSNRYDVYINGRRFNSVRGTHHNYRNQPCYLSDPWHEAANVYVTNLKIIRGTNPNGGCRRRVKRKKGAGWSRKGERRTKKQYYKRLYSVGKKLGKIFIDDQKRKDKREKMMNPFGGFIVGVKDKSTDKNGLEVLMDELRRFKRRLIDVNENDENIILGQKKCFFVELDRVEICVVYYNDKYMRLEYNIVNEEDVNEMNDGYYGLMELNVWIWNKHIEEECNYNLFMGYKICVYNNVSDGIYVVIRENDVNGLLVNKIDLINDNKWDKIYIYDGNGEYDKKMCKYIRMNEICFETTFDNTKLKIISSK